MAATSERRDWLAELRASPEYAAECARIGRIVEKHRTRTREVFYRGRRRFVVWLATQQPEPANGRTE
jgi:hypothetical protein